jgi:hypothetical protein
MNTRTFVIDNIVLDVAPITPPFTSPDDEKAS